MNYRNKAFTSFELMIVVVILAVLITLGSGPIFGTDPQGAKRTLEAQGYTQVEITGYRWFAGGQGDFYKTGFRAKSPNGTEITGAVCRGLWFKGTTIRFD